MDLKNSKDGRAGTVATERRDQDESNRESCRGQTTSQMEEGPNEPIKTGLSEVGPEEPVEVEDDHA